MRTGDPILSQVGFEWHAAGGQSPAPDNVPSPASIVCNCAQSRNSLLCRKAPPPRGALGRPKQGAGAPRRPPEHCNFAPKAPQRGTTASLRRVGLLAHGPHTHGPLSIVRPFGTEECLASLHRLLTVLECCGHDPIPREPPHCGARTPDAANATRGTGR
jgi:hypothetical protein